MPKYNNGELIVYTVTENTVSGYTTEINGTDITNSHTPGETSVTITKRWEDGNNQDGVRPDDIKVQLYADGEKLGKEETLNIKNNWTTSWSGLDEKKAGEVIIYTVQEVGNVDGYETTIDGFDHGNIIITNSYTPETTELSGIKTWDDKNNQDGKRPESITMNLLANGSIVESKEVKEDRNWSYEFTNLPKNKEGQEILYTVTENTVPEYTTEIDGANITNHYTPGKTSVTATKHWNDSNDQDAIRPDDIKVQLYANGQTKGAPVTLNAKNNWTTTWSDLDEKINGEMIVYSIEEINIADGYSATIDASNKGNIILTNTHNPIVPNPEEPNSSTPGEGNLDTTGIFPLTGENAQMIYLLVGILLIGLAAYIIRNKMRNRTK